MKISFAALSAGEGEEHCERLRDREHDIRDRLAYAPPYSEERKDWSIAFAKCVTSVSGAGIAKT
jgi:hypothetical protein